ncbi:MAG: hypothetical protein LBN27_13990 [Prevotellaceae bacterium]|jgi:hypothetical protein|nr:hypothetical protein [Prevotellaceae bacterium]
METTAVRKRTISPTRKATREKVFIDIPQADMLFLQLFADKMGWLVNNKQNLWDKYVQSSPQNVDLSDEDIMKEVRAVRYGEM